MYFQSLRFSRQKFAPYLVHFRRACFVNCVEGVYLKIFSKSNLVIVSLVMGGLVMLILLLVVRSVAIDSTVLILLLIGTIDFSCFLYKQLQFSAIIPCPFLSKGN